MKGCYTVKIKNLEKMDKVLAENYQCVFCNIFGHSLQSSNNTIQCVIPKNTSIGQIPHCTLGCIFTNLSSLLYLWWLDFKDADTKPHVR